MAKIEVTIRAENDLTVFTVEGALTADEIIHYSTEYYMTKPTKLVLWDATKGSVYQISIDEFRKIAQHMKKFTAMRKGGKTAFVGNFDADFGVGRMYEAFAEMEKLPIFYRTFRNIEDANKWLFSN